MSKWVVVLWVHLFGSWGFVGDEFRDKPARARAARVPTHNNGTFINFSASIHFEVCRLKKNFIVQSKTLNAQ